MLTVADIVVVTADIARKPGMTRDDLFKTNASIIRDIFTTIASTCSTEIPCVVTNPVNSTLPVTAENRRKAEVFNPARLFGATTLDVVRAYTFIAHSQGDSVNSKAFKVPGIGGPSGATILPLYSQDEEVLVGVIHRVRFGGDEIVKNKQGVGSATTCRAYAGFCFIKATLAARDGEAVTEEAHVYLPGIPEGKEIAAELGAEYCAVKVVLGRGGAAKALHIGEISESGKGLLEVAVGELKGNIETGMAFVGA